MLLIPHLCSLFPRLFEKGVPGTQQALLVCLAKVFVHWGGRFLVLSLMLLFDSYRTLWMAGETIAFFLRATVFVLLEYFLQYKRGTEDVSRSPRQEKRWMNSSEDQSVNKDTGVDQWQKRRCWTSPEFAQCFLQTILPLEVS